MQISNEGSVRVDLVGGTLDIEPINLILPQVVTLNVATSLKAQVKITENNKEQLEIISEDYNQSYAFPLADINESNFFEESIFKEMSFIVQIFHYFSIKKGLTLNLSSGAPAGSGLGGSSAMGVTVFKALLKYTDRKMTNTEIVRIVKNIEGRILNKGMAGYQDYYPALTGGVLALKASTAGLEVEQLYDEKLKEYLQTHFILAYSGISRNSGINNWEVYKNFFDQNKTVREGLAEIAKIAYSFYECLKNGEYQKLAALITAEGEIREKLFKGITPPEVKEVMNELISKKLSSGYKMCGAGGGGCFLIAGTNYSDIAKVLENNGMRVLPFIIDEPINEK